MIFTKNACNIVVIFMMFVVGNGTLRWQELGIIREL